MNRGHKLVKKTETVEHKQQAKRASRDFYINIALMVVVAIVVGIASYTPFKYSTTANNRIVHNLTDAITGEVGGIVASEKEIEVEGYDYKVASSQEYITTLGDKQMGRLKRLKELKVLKTNVDIDDLWAIYYAYYAEEYNTNLTLYQRLTAWFSDLQAVDIGDFEHDCTGAACTFISELSNILAVDDEWLKNSNGHAAYHKQLEESLAELEIEESDLELAYEAYVLTRPEYITAMSLDITILNHTLLNNNPKLANWALNSPAGQVNAILGKIKYSVDLNQAEIAEIMQFVDFTSDDEIITDEVVAYLPNSLFSFGVDADGLSTGNTTIVNVTDVENLEEWLAENKQKTYYKNAATDVQIIDLGYAQLHWDIKSIDYIDNIPSFEEIMQDAEWVHDMKTQLLEQAVWQSFYSGE